MDWFNTLSLSSSGHKKSFVEQWLENIDLVAVLLIIILFFIGLTIQSIAASELPEVSWFKQLIIGLVGMIGMFTIAMLPRWAIVNYAMPLLLVLSVVMMIMTLLFGIEKNGATRWLSIPIVNMQFQPMELYKVCSISVLAIILGWMTEMNCHKLARLGVMVIFVGVTIVLGSLQPDMGQMLITCIAMVFITLLSIRLSFLSTVAFIAVCIGVFAAVVLNAQHSLQRFLDFFAGEVSDKTQSGYANYVLDRALLIGRPEGKSYWQHLADVETDYVFVLISAEFGILMALLLVVMLVSVYLRLLWSVWDSEDIKLRFWSWGLVVVYTAQIFINVGTATRLSPTKGITLPILSYGGSSLLTVFFALGLLLFISRRDIKDA